MTDFEFLKGRFQMFFGFILAMIWSGLEIMACVNPHVMQPNGEFTGFIIGINCIFIAANSSGTAKVAQFIKGYVQNKTAMNHVLAQERLQYRIEKDRMVQSQKLKK